jgi:hypothetical protein
MTGLGFHLKPRPFHGQPKKDRDGAPCAGDHVFNVASPDPCLAGASEQTPRVFDMPSGSPGGGGEGAHSEHRVHNLHHNGCND